MVDNTVVSDTTLEVKEDTLSILKSIIKQNQTTNQLNGVQNISCKQGSSLSSLIYKYNYSWNTTFANSAIFIENKSEVIIGGLKFIFLSPTQEKLKKLSKKWLQELSKKKYSFEISDEEIFDDAFEFYMKFLQDTDIKMSTISSKKNLNFEEISEIEEKDNSMTNGSSLAFIIEYKNKNLLFLGDSHEDIIFENYGEKLKDDLQKYCEPFSFKSSNDSFGLGLYIVDNILKANNYTLKYEYKDNKNIFICEKDRKSTI